jgi:hypothetical protein
MLMKFFRKHNKQLLAFFMVALMIVFIGGSALQGLMTPKTNPVVANSRYGPVTLVDQQNANAQTNLLELMQMDWRRPVPGGGKPLEVVDWILLRREAQALGASLTPAAVRASATDPSFLDRINDVAQGLRQKPEVIHAAMADFRSVQQAAMAVAGSTVPSEAELMTAARDALETVSIRAVLLPAKAFVDENLSFSDAEIQAQFAKFRDKERGGGLNFGYFRPPSLKAQYVKIDRQAIAAAVGVANLDRKAKTYYEENRTKNPGFRKKEGPPGPDPAAAGLIAGPPAPPFDPYLAWDDAKDIAIEVLRKQNADQAAERIANWLVQYAAESWLEVERGKDGYRVAPEGTARLDYYEDVIRHIPASMAFPGAVTAGATDFFTADEAPDVPELGAARFRPERGDPQSFAALAFRTKAIIPKVPTEEGANSADYLATFQSCSLPLTHDKTGDLYIFRIVDAKPAHAPESVAEVRDQVMDDLRLLKAYDVAKARAESLRSCAASGSLREAYEADTELVAFKERSEGAKSGFFEPPPMSRVLKQQAAKGRSPNGVFVGLGIEYVPNDVVDQCFALEHAEGKMKVLELKDRAAVLLAEWVETKPAPEDDFNTLRKQLVSQLADARWRIAAAAWLDPEKVRARTGFAFVTR